MALALVAQIYGLETADIRIAKRGTPRVAMARQVAIYLCHIVFRMGVTALGNAFARDRATALHAIRHVEELRDDPDVDRVLLQLETMLRAATSDRS